MTKGKRCENNVAVLPDLREAIDRQAEKLVNDGRLYLDETACAWRIIARPCLKSDDGEVHQKYAVVESWEWLAA